MKMTGKCGDVCTDNRFKIIEGAKRDILDCTNIESSPTDMAALDSMLFRAWQMGWLKEYDNPWFCCKRKLYDAIWEMTSALRAVKDGIETDRLYAPGASPTYEAVEEVLKIWKRVLDALSILENK